MEPCLKVSMRNIMKFNTLKNDKDIFDAALG